MRISTTLKLRTPTGNKTTVFLRKICLQTINHGKKLIFFQIIKYFLITQQDP